VIPACGSRRVAGYLEDLENCSATSSGTSETGTTQSSGSSGDTSSSGDTAGTTTEGSETTETSSGTTDATGTTTGTETTDSSSTGEPATVCGNGVLEAFGPEPEECDDGNLDPDDGCNDTCALDRRVFVTSVDYQAGELQSLKLADALCGNLADDQGWPDALKYRAWLSDSTTDARDRFKQGRGRLVMVNGLVLAASWSALLAGELQNPLEVTEKSETYHGGVWTGTRPDGTAVPGAEHCDDWSTSSFLKTGHYGYSDRTTPEWTLSALDDNPSGCPIAYALYCMQSL
jgi:cysteine-rich repeat protein